MTFFIPPVLETLKKKYPNCHITLVTVWGFKETKRKFPAFKKNEYWGNRNQSGFSLHLLLTNPHIDQLIHWHDTKTSLEGNICKEDGHSIPTWSKKYYLKQKKSGHYDAVYELDFGLSQTNNPIQEIYKAIQLPRETFSNYKLYFTKKDKVIAKKVIRGKTKPRIVLLEGLEGTTTRGWDPAKVKLLEQAIEKKYKTKPIWFGGRYNHDFEGQPLTLRENIATLLYCDIGIGVLSGPLHFAAAVGLPTLTLLADQPIHRAAPAYFLNSYIKNKKKHHRTLLGPDNKEKYTFLKDDSTQNTLTPSEWSTQKYTSWQNPGRQSKKTGLATITVDEVMTVVQDMLA